MRTPRSRSTAVVLVVVGLIGALAGCQGDTAPPTATTALAPAEKAPSDRVPPPPDSIEPVSVYATIEGVEIDFEIGPVAISDGVGILRVQAEATGGDSTEASLGTHMRTVGYTAEQSVSGIDLIEIERSTILRSLHDREERPAATIGRARVGQGKGPTVVYVAYPVPETSTVAALVPLVGLVEGVPVIAAHRATVEMATIEDLTPADVKDLEVRTAVLEAYQEEGDGVRTRVGEETTVSVDSDFLFAIDSADLSSEADSSLIVAGRQISVAEGGTITVAGHTDDVGEDAHNVELSQRRAQAVADRLGQLIDLSSYEIVVEGRGESEPVADNGSDEGRAQNRRVELLFLSNEPASTKDPGGAGFPASVGPTAPGAEGVQVVQSSEFTGDVPFTVSVDEVRRVDDYLVGTFTVGNVSDVDAFETNFLGASSAGRGNSHTSSATNLTLLVGSSRVYPVDYQEDWTFDDFPMRHLVADNALPGLSARGTMTVTVMWPDVGEDTVTIDAPALPSDNPYLDATAVPFRLTAVAVTG